MIETTVGYPDFIGEVGYTRTEWRKKFCSCRYGRELEVEDAYERGFTEGKRKGIDTPTP